MSKLCFTKEQLSKLHWTDGLSRSEIAEMYGVTTQAITYWCQKLDVEHRSRTHHVLFKPSPVFSYVLGVYYSDGCFQRHPAKRFRVQVVDKIFAESIHRAVAILLGSAPSMTPIPPQDGCKPQWLVSAGCKELIEWVDSKSNQEMIDFAMTYPADFVRGLFEGDGSMKTNKGQPVAMIVCNTDREMIESVVSWLKREELDPHVSARVLPSGKDFYEVCIYRQMEIRKFLCMVNPCFKYLPRAHANTEPSPDESSGKV